MAGARCGGLAQEFDSIVVTTEMVAMRDGVKLAMDVYRPARSNQAVDERFPVLLSRTPYNKNSMRGEAEYLARRGFVVAAQDCRGRFASQGDFYAFLNEGKDGYDSIEWAAAQPWSNGKVGTFGGSYVAWNQYHAAMYKPPHLEAMFALVGGANFYQEYGYPGGAPNLGWPMWLLGSARTSQQAAANPDAVAKMSEAGKQTGTWLREEPKKRGEIFDGFPCLPADVRGLAAHPNVRRVLEAAWLAHRWLPRRHERCADVVYDWMVRLLRSGLDAEFRGSVGEAEDDQKADRWAVAPRRWREGMWRRLVRRNSGSRRYGLYLILVRPLAQGQTAGIDRFRAGPDFPHGRRRRVANFKRQDEPWRRLANGDYLASHVGKSRPILSAHWRRIEHGAAVRSQ